MLSALVAGCGGDTESRRATTGEIRWLERLDRWEDHLVAVTRRALETYYAVLGGEERPDELRRALRLVRSCSEGLDRDVGTPPNTRFLSAFELLRQACVHVGRSAGPMEEAALGANPGDALFEYERLTSKSDELFDRAGREIERRLQANRVLPRIGGETTRSRIEPRFSRVASAIVGRDVEVVCWSPREWPRVLDEWGAYIGTRDFGAFAQYRTDRASLSPNFCEKLVDLTYRKRRPQSGLAKDEIAGAVGILAHEAEHLVSAPAGEAETECYAMQDLRLAARLLGASREYATGLADYYWQEVYKSLSDEYVSAACGPDGPWDRNDASPVWP